MFGLQGYGFNDQERSNVTDQFIRSIFADLARNAPTLHQGGIGSSVSSIDDIARAMYERKQQEAADSQQAEQQAFYRDMASRQQGLSEEKHAYGMEKDQAATAAKLQGTADEEARRAGLKAKFEEILGTYQGSDRDALGLQYELDPKSASKGLTSRLQPEEPKKPQRPRTRTFAVDGGYEILDQDTGQKRFIPSENRTAKAKAAKEEVTRKDIARQYDRLQKDNEKNKERNRNRGSADFEVMTDSELYLKAEEAARTRMGLDPDPQAIDADLMDKAVPPPSPEEVTLLRSLPPEKQAIARERLVEAGVHEDVIREIFGE